VALKDDGKRGTVVRGDGEVAALVELSRREAEPVAVDAANQTPSPSTQMMFPWPWSL
jgi:hypothetical protein